jgi:hypothetical protein
MRSWRITDAFGCGLACASVLELFACGTDLNGEGPALPDGSVADAGNDVVAADAQPDIFGADVVQTDAAPRDSAGEDVAGDAGLEAQPPPTCGSCGGACCGDQCVFRYCPNCSTGAIFCPYDLGVQDSNGYCIGACSACAPGGTPALVTCYTCGGGITLGSCAASASDCPQTLSNGACACPEQDAGQCPGANQVCTSVNGQYVCLTP